jgi:hypothetical protein
MLRYFVNGDFIFSGHTDVTAANISNTQLAFNNNSDSTRVDMNWARFEVGDALPLVVPNPPRPGVMYDGSYFGGNPIKQGWLGRAAEPWPNAYTRCRDQFREDSEHGLLLPIKAPERSAAGI